MRKIVLCIALVSLLAPGGQAFARICTIDDVPSATLLLPYFEVDLDNTNGINTLFEINNATAEEILAHVVVWTDLSVPVLDFNVYLSGYDIVPVSVRDVLNLVLPDTAPPASGGEPFGDFSVVSSDPLFDLSTCDDQLPPPPLPAAFATGIQSALTGQPSQFPLGGNCGGVDHADNIARGYITVDVVRRCSLLFPDDPGYFVSGGAGDATNSNVLWGHYYYVEPNENFAQAETMVHIEASPSPQDNNLGGPGSTSLGPPAPGRAFAPTAAELSETTAAGEHTFYGRYVGFLADDNREPLATSFTTRYLSNTAFSGGTDFIVWRDAKLVIPDGGFVCGGPLPSPFSLGQEALVIFDEMENPDVIETPPISPTPPTTQIAPFPWETQRVLVGGENLPLPAEFEAGWMHLNLNHTIIGAPPEDETAAQAWVTVVASAEGRFSVGFDAIAVDTACAGISFEPGP